MNTMTHKVLESVERFKTDSVWKRDKCIQDALGFRRIAKKATEDWEREMYWEKYRKAIRKARRANRMLVSMIRLANQVTHCEHSHTNSP